MKFYLVLLTALAVMLSSCEDDTQLISTESSSTHMVNGQEVLSHNGLLHLPSIEVAAALAQSVETEPLGSVLAELHNISGFISAGDRFDAITEDLFTTGDGVPAAFRQVAYLETFKGDKYLQPVSDEPLFLHFANQNGQVVIGDLLLTYLPNRGITIPIKEYDEYGANPMDSPNATVYSFSKITLESSIITKTRNVGFCEADFSPRRRIRGELEENIGFLGELGDESTFNIRARTKHTRRGLFNIYYPELAQTIEHVGSVRETTGDDILVDDRCTGCNSLNTLMANDSPGIIFGSGGLTSEAFDGSRGSCSFDL